MRARLRPILALALVLAATGVARAAHADPPPGDRKRAAAAFDEGIARFDRAEFAEAARAFLEADRLSPSAVALSNAMGAAKRAGDHLLVARTAEKAIARGDGVVEARAALAEAATKLARLELGCEGTPCALAIDGEPVPDEGAASRTPGASVAYVLPGTHRIEARGLSAIAGAVADERVVCVAGATYRVALRPVAPEAGADQARAPSGRLPPAVFLAGVGVTVVLGAVTAWSGADALSSKGALPAMPSQGQEDDVLARARRTDYLLLGTGLAAAGSAVLGAWLTDWHRAPAAATASVAFLPRGGAAVAVGGRF